MLLKTIILILSSVTIEMAIQTDPIFDGFRGSVNHQLLFRQCWGKTVVSSWPDRSEIVYTPLQIAEQQRFKDAVAFARVVIKLPLLKARYADMASKLGFRSAWNVAIAEYMSKTELTQKPKKIWFDSAIIRDGMGPGFRVKLYKLVYPDNPCVISDLPAEKKVFPLWPNAECSFKRTILFGGMASSRRTSGAASSG